MSARTETSQTTEQTDPSAFPEAASHYFQIQTVADPSALSRVMELFAQRSLLPVEVSCKHVCHADGDDLHIHIAINDLCPNIAANLAARLSEQCKVLDQSLLFSGAVQQALPEGMIPLGQHALRNISETTEIYTSQA